MYKVSDLEKYDYFKNVDLNYAFDSLTGVITRGNILGFAKDLIEKKTPFTMMIMDIDNFKAINDNFGHMYGDDCLKSLTTPSLTISSVVMVVTNSLSSILARVIMIAYMPILRIYIYAVE